MAWIKVVTPPHSCDVPSEVPDTFGVGSIWLCAECNNRYEYMGTRLDYFGDPCAYFEELTS